MTARPSSPPPNVITTPAGEPRPAVAGAPGVPVSDTGAGTSGAPAPSGTPADTPPADAPKRLLSRTDILGASDTKYEVVHVPEWGKDAYVRVRSMKAGDRDQMERAITDADEQVSSRQVRARIVSLCVVDDEGKPLFTKDDVALLAERHVAPMQRIFEAVALLNAFSNEDVESLAKN